MSISADNSLVPSWTPSLERKMQSNLLGFANVIDRKYGYRKSRIHPATTEDFIALHRWSCDNLGEFWSEAWDFVDLINAEKGNIAYVKGKNLKDSYFFPYGVYSYAENVLRVPDDSLFCTVQVENLFGFSLTRRQAYDEVSKLQQVLFDEGVKPGDIVVAVVANLPETILTMLAVNSLGAIWSAGSCDFGLGGLYDRFSQLHPKFMIATDSYVYKGKIYEIHEKVMELTNKIPEIEVVMFFKFLKDKPKKIINQKNMSNPLLKVAYLDDLTKKYNPHKINFYRTKFNEAIWILFSSGTTGAPKAIVHRNSVMLQKKREQLLHVDLKAGDKYFQFTTCGWMLWNSLVTILTNDVAILLYEGSPFYPHNGVFFEYILKQDCRVVGLVPKYLEQLKKDNFDFSKYDLSRLKTLIVTGAIVTHELYDFIYKNIKKDLYIVNETGGTDIASSCSTSNLFMPTWRGEIVGHVLGMEVECYNEEGKNVVGAPGELVISKPWPSQPLRFVNDPGDRKYSASYFEKFPNVWAHGDWIEINPKTLGMIVYGRSDAVLNPGGVRIGTAEIYRQVEKVQEVVESVAIGLQTKPGEEEVILFVIIKDDNPLTDKLVKHIKDTIRINTTARHIPSRIIKVSSIPRTVTGKIAELTVKNVLYNRPIKNIGALANPESLKEFEKYALAKPSSKL